MLYGDTGLEYRDKFEEDIVCIKVSDKYWQSVFAYLVDSCRAIIVIPSTSEGCLEEMAYLQQSDHLRKTLVLMPPYRRGERSGFEEAWENVRASLKSSPGLDLPEYTGGILYLANVDFSVKKAFRVNKFYRGLEDAIGELDKLNNKRTLPLKDIFENLIDKGAHYWVGKVPGDIFLKELEKKHREYLSYLNSLDD